MQIGVLDVILAAVLLVAVIRCTIRGFIAEFMSLAGIILSLVAAITLYRTGSAYLERTFGESAWNPVISFLMILLVVYLVVKILESALHRLLEAIHLEKLDRAFGFLLGWVEGVLLVVLIVMALQLQPFFDAQELLDESLGAQWTFRYLPPVLQELPWDLNQRLEVLNV